MANPIPKTISAVLPAYNEEENIEKAVTDMVAMLESLAAPDYEVVVVDDGSSDGTAAICERLSAGNGRVRLVRHPTNLGYAHALKTGFASARHALIFYTDSDNQFDVRELKNFLPAIDDYDIVVGFRIYRYDPPYRLMVAWAYNVLVRVTFGIRPRDIDCAFKLFRREVFDKVTIETKGFFVDAEIMAKARYYGYSMTEIGVRHYPRMAGRSTINVRAIGPTLRALWQIWKQLHIQRPPKH
ncbi:MAG: glycosyltransferase family 2 protein [Chloroflexi bacterium]|nr:glycosyltransferase family 2 protein [Chloroflexota bacterium]